jgi:hypothetical protein
MPELQATEKQRRTSRPKSEGAELFEKNPAQRDSILPLTTCWPLPCYGASAFCPALVNRSAA